MDWKNKTLLVLFFLPLLTLCQINKDFINYMGQNKLSNELSTYLMLHADDFKNSDSSFYYKGKLSLLEGNLSSFYHNYTKASKLFSSDSTVLLIANNLFLKSPRETAIDWFNQDIKTFKGANTLNTYKAFHLSENPFSSSSEFLPPRLLLSFESYKKYHKKKPIVAACLSMVVPGLGKVYSGRKHGFWPSFLSNVLYGIQSAENIKVLGVKHPYTIFTMSLFSVFYISNIYGSAHDVRQVKIEKRKQFLHEVSDYYYSPYLFE